MGAVAAFGRVHPASTSVRKRPVVPAVSRHAASFSVMWARRCDRRQYVFIPPQKRIERVRNACRRSIWAKSSERPRRVST